MGLQVICCFPDIPIASLSLALFDFRQWRVHANPKDIEGLKDGLQLAPPSRFLNNVLNEEVIACLGKCTDRSVEAIEEPCPLVGRSEPSISAKARFGELIRSLISKWLGNRAAKRFCQGSFPRTRGAIQKDNPAGLHANPPVFNLSWSKGRSPANHPYQHKLRLQCRGRADPLQRPLRSLAPEMPRLPLSAIRQSARSFDVRVAQL